MGTKLVSIVISLIIVIYPLLALALIRVLNPFWILAILVSALLLRLVLGIKTSPIALTIGAAAAIAATLLTSFIDPKLGILLYPAFMTGAMLIGFGWSLFNPPSMIERFARIFEPDLPDAAIPYTRNVTAIWCVFFVFNICVSLWTAFQMSFEMWSLYNGLISYCLMGLLMGGEFLVRRRVQTQ
jgi:uncharacterized membrane protein